ncbi:nitroreductase family protein [uncultured Tateyamaria sp.]|uniref:nitroreductase family protein n=1 Tax=uncultured Tateyamaria sp. TaxID=455651 RepID=UPI00263560A1|nr:nitroreductase family protein [uncultured Tateyamaria sp.]
MTTDPHASLQPIFAARFADPPTTHEDAADTDLIRSMAGRGSCRAFLDDPVPAPLIETLCATALAAPTKSDLQQRDIVLIQSSDIRQRLAELVAGQAWVADAPMIAVFCGNNRRQRLLHDWHGVPFANDHLDALFNAVGDAAIALGAFVTAAEALGLGCCPISAVRNEAAAVSELLQLPSHVFPFAGLAFGYPASAPLISMRLPLSVTCHVDRYQEAGLRDAVQTYDRARAETQPYDKQRFLATFGDDPDYGWSTDKVRQYNAPERDGFGDYIRAQGFKLD